MKTIKKIPNNGEKTAQEIFDNIQKYLNDIHKFPTLKSLDLSLNDNVISFNFETPLGTKVNGKLNHDLPESVLEVSADSENRLLANLTLNLIEKIIIKIINGNPIGMD